MDLHMIPQILLYTILIHYCVDVQCCDTMDDGTDMEAELVFIYPADGEMVLTCNTMWNMVWMKEDDILVNGPIVLTNDSRVNISQKNLVIKDVTRADAGLYRCCEFSGMDKKTQLQKYNVIIVENMTFSGKSPEFVSEKNTSDVKLWCNITGYPPPQITWYAMHNSKLESIGIHGPLLRISNLQKDCTSRFTCVGNNTACQPINHTMTVAVEGSPFVYIDVESDNVTYHDEFTLVPHKRSNTAVKVTCSVDLVPVGNVSWFIGDTWLGRTVLTNDGTQIKSERNSNHQNKPSLLPTFEASLTEYTRVDLNMMIAVVEDSDFDKNYTCIAENEYGRDEWTLLFQLDSTI